MQSQSKPKLIYFDMKAQAEPVRLIFAIGDIDFEDQRISKEEFYKLKEANSFKYGQLPVLEVDGKQYAQSAALVKYSAQRARLLPTDPLELLKAEQLYSNFQEIIVKLVPTYNLKGEEQANARKELVDVVFPKWFKAIETDLVQNGSTGFTAGNQLSYADVYLFTYIEWYSSCILVGIPTDIASQYPNIQSVYKNVANHPKVVEWKAKH